MLIVELDGPQVEVDELFAIVEAVCRARGRRDASRSRATQAARERIWKGRKAAFAAMGRVSPNYYVQDGVVPRTRLPEVLRRIRELEARSGLRIGNVFHAGDGNLHPLICYDESIPGQAEHAEAVASEILSYCIEAGGAITGEHGVGADKKAYMPKMFTADDLDAMQLRALRVRSVGHLQSGQGVPDAAAVRRSARAVPRSIRSSAPGSPSGSDADRSPRRSERAAAMRPSVAALLAQAQRRIAHAGRAPRGERHRSSAWRGRGAPASADRSCSTTAPRPSDRALRRRSDGDVPAGATLADGQRGAGARAASGCRSTRRRPTAPRSAASSPPTTAARGATHGAPRDLIIGIEMVLRRRHASPRRAAASSRTSPATIWRGCCADRSAPGRDHQRDLQAGAAAAGLAHRRRDGRATRAPAATLALAVAASPHCAVRDRARAPPHRVLVRFETTARRRRHAGATAAASLCLAQGATPSSSPATRKRSCGAEYERHVWAPDGRS